MTRLIYKYPLGLALSVAYQMFMPEGAKPLSVGEENGQLVLWAEVATSAPLASWDIAIVWTGHGEPPDDMPFVGTVQRQGGLVCHVYARQVSP